MPSFHQITKLTNALVFLPHLLDTFIERIEHATSELPRRERL